MKSKPGPRLLIPVALSITTIAVVVACTGREGTPADTVADSSSTGASSVPICTDLADQPMCKTESQCIWLPELGGCIRNCEMLTDLDVCMNSVGCEVYGDACSYEPIA